MSTDYNCESFLNFGLLWQRSKCAESPMYQLFPYFLFWTCMSEIKSRHFSRSAGKFASTKLKKLTQSSL